MCVNMTLGRRKEQSRRNWKGEHDQNTLYAHMIFSKNIFEIIKKKKKKESHSPTPEPQILGTFPVSN